ncbi:MAG TPA: hypothetical protein VFG04_07275 [Planctomycetaceae bacterium]|nr:hypothetical protein [Planctomycetaceae bacterium]
MRSNAFRLVTFSLGIAVGLCCSTAARSQDGLSTVPPEKRAAQTKPVKKPLLTFAQNLRANFAKWDRDKDGKLSRSEINLLVMRPDIRGRVAATVAVLHLYLRERPEQDSVTMDELIPGGIISNASNLDGSFDTFYSRLTKIKREVFAGGCTPSMENASQLFGDCYYLATLGSVMARDPKIVQEMIHPQPNGSIEVAFPAGPKIRVRRMSDTQLALTSTAENQGMWLNILEKAYGQACMVHPELRGPKRQEYDLDIDVMSRGGDARHTIELFAEHVGTFITFRHDEEEKIPPTEGELSKLRPKLHEIMKSRVENHAIMIGATAAGDLPPGINAHHDFSIVGYDADQRIVHLWNPNGKSSPAGSQLVIKHGSFDMSLDEFLKTFAALFYETDVPRPERRHRTLGAAPAK